MHLCEPNRHRCCCCLLVLLKRDGVHVYILLILFVLLIFCLTKNADKLVYLKALCILQDGFLIFFKCYKLDILLIFLNYFVLSILYHVFHIFFSILQLMDTLQIDSKEFVHYHRRPFH